MITTDVSNRAGFIGGSDLASILNLAPYGCARRCWYQKSGVTPDREFVMNGAMEIGVALEDFVAKKAADKMGLKLIRRKAKSAGHEGVHIDREIQGDPAGPGVAEIKVIGDQSYWKWLREGVPMGYLLQLQWGMHLWDRRWGAIIAWNRDMGGDPHVFRFEYSASIVAGIQQHAEAFWSMVENGLMPEPLSPRDSRCDSCEWAVTCREQEWKEVSKDVLATNSVAINRWLELKRLSDDTEAALKSARAIVDDELADVEEARCGDFRLVFRPQESWRIDTDALKREQPELAAKYMKKSVSRPLRVYQIKEKK